MNKLNLTTITKNYLILKITGIAVFAASLLSILLIVFYSLEIGITLLVFTTITLLILFVIYSAIQLNKLDIIRWREQLFLQSIMDNMCSLFFVKDTTGKYILINKAYETSIGVKNQDVIGKTDLEIFPEVYAKEYMLNDQRINQ